MSEENESKNLPVEHESAFPEIHHPKKRAFLTALVETGGNITRATELAEIDRSTPYSQPWLEDEEFQEALSRAKLMAADHLEAEAVRRAYEGVKEPVGFYQGAPSAYVQKYSDTLLIFLLKGLKPEKYVDRIEHSGEGGGPIPVAMQIQLVKPDAEHADD